MNRTREERINDTFVTLADSLVDDYDVTDLLHTLVETCSYLLDADSGGILLRSASGVLVLAAASSADAGFVELFELAAGAGPCLECASTGKAVAVANVVETAGRWPEFSAAAISKGFGSVHATPMRLRGEVIGAMTLFRTKIGLLTPADVAVAKALADVATIGILQERLIRETGLVSEQLGRALESRVLIEQAKGMISVVGVVSFDEAFATLRGYARRHNLTLREVAEQVTQGTLDVLT